MNQHLLQIELSPAEYQAFPPLQEAYLQNIPNYVIARCPLSWKLTKWVRSGKLQWLDPDVPDLPLRTGPVEVFPYVNIQGRKDESNVYRDGKWINPSFWASLKREVLKRYTRAE